MERNSRDDRTGAVFFGTFMLYSLFRVDISSETTFFNAIHQVLQPVRDIGRVFTHSKDVLPLER